MDMINCRTCFERKLRTWSVRITNKCRLNQTIKEAILLLVPDLFKVISDDDYVCQMCLKSLRFCSRFIDKCKNSQSKFAEREDICDEDAYFDPTDEDCCFNEKNYNQCNDQKAEDKTYYQIEEQELASHSINNQEEKVPDSYTDDTKESFGTISERQIENNDHDQEQQIENNNQEQQVESNYQGQQFKNNNQDQHIEKNDQEQQHNNHEQQVENNDQEQQIKNNYQKQQIENNDQEQLIENDDAEQQIEDENVTQSEEELEADLTHNDHDYPLRINFDHNDIDSSQDDDGPVQQENLLSLKLPEGDVVPEILTTLQNCGIKIHQYSSPNIASKRILLLGPTVHTKCPSCSQTFLTEKSLKEHERKKHKKYKRKTANCPRCGRELREKYIESHLTLCVTTPCPYCRQPIGKGLMKKHVADVHNLNTPFKCEKCGKTFSISPRYKDHVRRCVPWECFHCKGAFNKAELPKHMREVHGDDKPFKCPTCGNGFAKYANYQTHMAGHKKFPCDVCKKEFKLEKSLTKHKIKFENVRCDMISQIKKQGLLVRTKMCYKCGQEFTKKKDYVLHKETHRQAMCEKCGKCFRNQSLLTMHRSSHNPENSSICHVCGKGFKNNSTLRLHLLTHFGPRSAACDRCPKRFHFKSSLLRHIKTVHDNIRDIPCQACSMMFCSKEKMSLHYRTVHIRLKPHKCDLCGRAFARGEHLRIHMRAHEKEKNGIKAKRGRKKRKIEKTDNSVIENVNPVDIKFT